MKTIRFADGRPRHCLRIAAYSTPWLVLCLLGAVGGSMFWLGVTVGWFATVTWLASVPIRSSVTLTDDDVIVVNGRRTRRFARTNVRTVTVKDNYAHLRVTGVRRRVRCWGLPCQDGILSPAAATLQQELDQIGVTATPV